MLGQQCAGRATRPQASQLGGGDLAGMAAAGLMSPLQGEGRKGGLFLYSKVCALY